ncbi:MAG: T9SS type A sorting domain-containing protein [Spirosomataceae bacterium]
MKLFTSLLVGLIGLFSVPTVARKIVPQSFRYQAGPRQSETLDRDTLNRGQLQFLTQVTRPNTTFLRLYFAGTQLGESSYLVLEGNDGTRQELRKQDLENWHYSSAYFNGQSVNVLLFTATGDWNVVNISGIKVSDEPTNKARQAATPQQTARQAAATSVTSPYAKAVGRFTNGTEAYGTGWIAPNGAIVTSQKVAYDINYKGFDVIEFNVPLSVATTVQHPAPQDQYPVEYRNTDGYQQFKFMGDINRPFRAHWGVVEALPNGTGLRPGERGQEYFRIATNPSNYTIDAMGDVPVDLLHYASQLPFGNLAGLGTHRTLQLTQTALLKQHTHLAPPENADFADRDLFVLYNMPPFTGSHEGAPIAYEGSNVAIGVHNEIEENNPAYGLGFRDDDFRNGLARFFSNNVAFVDPEGLYDPGTGEIHKPFRTENKAARDAPAGAQVYFARGEYYGPSTFNRPMTLRAPVGKVTMGLPFSSARKAVGSTVSAQRPASSLDRKSAETAEKVQVYPNPFREHTQIKYPFAAEGPVSVHIVDMTGVSVAVFHLKSAATDVNEVQWNGTDRNGMPVPPGLYLVKVNNGRQTFTTKVLKQ